MLISFIRFIASTSIVSFLCIGSTSINAKNIEDGEVKRALTAINSSTTETDKKLSIVRMLIKCRTYPNSKEDYEIVHNRLRVMTRTADCLCIV